ncbi:hypothetical protein P8452_40952 [Trifolium repens]|nr:hypothetical protein QL285_024931 [Trifolium repens]WJX55145.1 hypothetical protein P8452_40952 [Trifolium repens]
MESISEAFVNSLWGSCDCDWAYLPAEGNSGGILSIWNKVKTSLVFTFIGVGFVGVCLDIVNESRRCFVVNVYAKCNFRAKQQLWSDLIMSKRGFGEGLWCVLGDFNSVRDSSERRGVTQLGSGGFSTEMVAFNSFITSLDLVDMPLVGRTFTWFHPNGISMSRLDRLLLSSSWADVWGVPTVWVLSRDVADHCPLVLKYSNSDWGPKPFRFNNFWLQNSSFNHLVLNNWGAHDLEGWMGFILKERLKRLKLVIKEWNGITYRRSEGDKQNLIDEILALDIKSETLGLIDDEVVKRKKLFEELWHLLKSMDAMAFQRSRSKWLKEGDLNSRYFHNCIKSRMHRNMMVALRTQHGWVEGPTQVREEVVSFFRNHFDIQEWARPCLDGIVFPQMSQDNMTLLTDIFSLVEISAVVKGCDGSKSPGPDGFNFAFVKHFWDLLKNEVRIMFDQFHGNECLPKCLSSYFLTLIPKVKSPQSLGDYRPISLLGCLYKMVAKVLATRLTMVLGDLIPKTQSAFLKGRQLVEGVVVVNEVIDFAKKSGKECLIFKVDFEKAYDSVDWGFLDYMLRRFGFDLKWRAWMKACVCTGSMSILVNGSPTEQICIKKGLKQGDPLAPLLFLIVAEGLGALMRSAVDRGKFKPFFVGTNGMPISILQYADDTLCIGEATVENLWAIKSVLRGFEMASGLKVNFWKSCIMGVNVSNDFLNLASGFLNCRIGQVPFIYLGLPVGANPRLASTWRPMVEVLKKRLGSWGNKYVSLGGRIVLINAVLSSIPIFFLSYMKMPGKVWREVVKLQRNFLWGGLSLKRRISWVKWEDVCRPKKEGGLGIRDLRLVNLSLLAKWRWKLLSSEDEVWKNVMMARYGGHVVGKVSLENTWGGMPCSSWWKNICCLDNHGEWFKQVVTKIVGRGNLCKFWKDIWVGNQSLEHRFPRLFSMSVQQGETITEVGSWMNRVWRWELRWRRGFFVWEEQLLHELEDVIHNVNIVDTDDRWVWNPDLVGGFSVKTLYVHLDSVLLPHNILSLSAQFAFNNTWKTAVPSKVCALAWQLLLNKIPTRENLFRRGVLHDDEISCPLCNETVESTRHLFLHCPFASAVWYSLNRWLGVVVVPPFEMVQAYEQLVARGPNRKIRKGFSGVWLAFVWVIWKTRNDQIFNNKVGNVEEALDSIQRLSWHWFLNKVASNPCLFYEWIWNPCDCMIR